MRLIRDGKIVADDFSHAPADATLDDLPEGDVIVPLRLWLAERAALLKRKGRIGVRLEPGERASAIGEDLAKLAAIVLLFPAYKDGRLYTEARLLRDRYGYQGEIRAVGDVLKDQMFYMARCGVNAFEPRADRDIGDALRSLSDFSVTYQAAADLKTPLHRRAFRKGAL